MMKRKKRREMTQVKGGDIGRRVRTVRKVGVDRRGNEGGVEEDVTKDGR